MVTSPPLPILCRCIIFIAPAVASTLLPPSYLHRCCRCIYIAVASTLPLPLHTSMTRLQASPFFGIQHVLLVIHPPNYYHFYVDTTSIKTLPPATIQMHSSPTNRIDTPKKYQKNCSEFTRAHRRCVFTSPSQLKCNRCNKMHLICFFNYSGKSSYFQCI
jgi:hypothetical protein